MPDAPSLYDTLHVPEDASRPEIRKNFKKLAQKHHPDKEGGDIKLFKQLKLAYETLYDDESREYYDKTGQAKSGPNAHQRALSELSGMFLSLLMENLDRLESVNIVQQVKRKITDSKKEVDQAVLKISSKIGKLNKAKGRLISKNDLLKSVIESKISELEGLIARNNETLKLLDNMRLLIDDYDYRIDEMSVNTQTMIDSGYFSIRP